MGHKPQFWEKDRIDFSNIHVISCLSFAFGACHIHSKHMTLNSLKVQILDSFLSRALNVTHLFAIETGLVNWCCVLGLLEPPELEAEGAEGPAPGSSSNSAEGEVVFKILWILESGDFPEMKFQAFLLLNSKSTGIKHYIRS